ncbi:hypothetical protein EDB83DRAFT_2309924 [Lactarius deliciosus]|nr:hypothetical protein EDB83DRAFT_2309924 [Lactarius deliciosus]
MPLFQKCTSDKLTNGAPLPGLADDPYVHKHGVKSSRWGVRQELSEAHSTYGAARWQRGNVTSTTGAISRLLRGKHGTLDVIADIRRLRAASTPAGRHNESKNTSISANATRTTPGIESIHASQSQANCAALGTRVKSDARIKTAVGAGDLAGPSFVRYKVLPVKVGSLVMAVILRWNIMGRWQGKLHDSGKTMLRRVIEKRRYSVTRHRRVGRGEEVDDNGNAAPVCATERDRDVEDRESDRGEPIIHRTHGRGQSKWGHGAPVPPTSHTIDIQKEKQEGSPVTEVGCPVGGAKSNSHGVPVTERAALYSLTKRELRHGGSRWGNLDIVRDEWVV